ncbi:MAG: hypothetical protein ACRD1U_17145 [Vicinamibacterales bacterium]
MLETAGNGSESRALEMRLSLPADQGAWRAIAGELAAKIAEYLGTKAPDAQLLGRSVEGLASQVASRGQQEDITFVFRQVNEELVIEARCSGRASEVRHPLPA